MSEISTPERNFTIHVVNGKTLTIKASGFKKDKGDYAFYWVAVDHRGVEVSNQAVFARFNERQVLGVVLDQE